jgi:predicted GIY-YIG superfamily endonuclease
MNGENQNLKLDVLEVDSRLDLNNNLDEVDSKVEGLTKLKNNQATAKKPSFIGPEVCPAWLVEKPVCTFDNFYTDDRKALYEPVKEKVIVYQLYNKITGHTYIGCSTNPLKRFRAYFQTYHTFLQQDVYKTKSILWTNIMEYGLEHFSMAVLDDYGLLSDSKITKEELLERENYLINKLYDTNPELLLNSKFTRLTASKKERDFNFKPIWLTKPIKAYKDLLVDLLQIRKDFRYNVFVYQFTNKFTGQIYIGSTCEGTARIDRYFNETFYKDYISNPICLEMKQWGHNCFQFAILHDLGLRAETPNAKNSIVFLEQKYITELKKKYPHKCLNVNNSTLKDLEGINLEVNLEPVFLELEDLPNTIPEPQFYNHKVSPHNKYVYIYNDENADLNTFVKKMSISECCKEYKMTSTTVHKYAKSGIIYKNIRISYSPLH